MRLWTIQGIVIYEQLQRDGVAYCTRPAWSDEEKFMNVNHPFLFVIRSSYMPDGHDILFFTKIETL